MKKKISEKDISDWKEFINSSEKLPVKDKEIDPINKNDREKTLDLHGCTLDNANNIAEEFIKTCYSNKISKIKFITGKGSRSKNKEDPYKSKTLGILKHSVPEFLKNNLEIMKMIKSIDEKQINDPAYGSFDVQLKKFKE